MHPENLTPPGRTTGIHSAKGRRKMGAIRREEEGLWNETRKWCLLKAK